MEKYKRIHFIGIGGVSMSGICELLIDENKFKISGSDNNKTAITEKLEKKGVKIYNGHSEKNIEENIDLVIYTAAIKEDNEELKKAKNLGIKTMTRSEFLGKLMKKYKYPLCIAGTHGKTTTSSLVSEVFLNTDKNPTISIGGILSSINGNLKIGEKEFFILETCEYCNSFLDFSPHSAIILNIDLDHLDYFQNLKEIYNSFKNFAKLIPDDACLIINSDIENYEYVTEGLKCKVITYGKDKKAMWQAKEIKYNEKGQGSYKAILNNEEMYDIQLSVCGEHNIYNSLAVCGLCNFYNIEKEKIEKGLKNFKGTKRRFEYKGEFNGVKVIDDYAHHPTEILTTIDSAKKQKYKTLWCVFQPHTFSRTKGLLKEFAKSFIESDKIIVLDIYSAREKDTKEVHAKDLVEELKTLNKNAYYMENFEMCKNFLKENCEKGDMVITVGAGNINELSEMLIQ